MIVFGLYFGLFYGIFVIGSVWIRVWWLIDWLILNYEIKIIIFNSMLDLLIIISVNLLRFYVSFFIVFV